MKLRMPFSKKDSLVIVWGRAEQCAGVYNKRDKKVTPLASLEDVPRLASYRRTVLILRRNMYIFKVVELPRLKKALIEKAVRTNISEWSPFRDPKYFYFAVPRETKIVVLVAMLKREDFEDIESRLRARGIKIDLAVPESVCYSRFFADQADTVGVVDTDAGVELLSYDRGIIDSQFVPEPKWNREALEYFIKGLGPKGLSLKEILSIGSRERASSLAEGFPGVRHVETSGGLDAVVRGSDFFSEFMTKSLVKGGRSLLRKEDLKSLKPGLVLIWAGVLLILGSQYFAQVRRVNGLKKDLSALQEKTAGLEAQLTRMNRLKERVDFFQSQANGYPAQLFLFGELKKNFSDGTYLTRYTFHKDKIEIFGVTPRSSDLLTGLSRTLVFSGVKFKSAIEKEVRTGKDKFEIELSVAK